MSRKLTASDRSALIRLASTMPAGSPERKAILAGLKTARFSSSSEIMREWRSGESPEAQKGVLGSALADAHDILGTVAMLSKKTEGSDYRLVKKALNAVEEASLSI